MAKRFFQVQGNGQHGLQYRNLAGRENAWAWAKGFAATEGAVTVCVYEQVDGGLVKRFFAARGSDAWGKLLG